MLCAYENMPPQSVDDHLWKGDLRANEEDSGSDSENFDSENVAILADLEGNNDFSGLSCAESMTLVPSNVSPPSEVRADEAETPKGKKRKRSISVSDGDDECSSPGSGGSGGGLSLSYVSVCQLFSRSDRSIFTEDVVCGAMRNLFQNEASGWESQLKSSKRVKLIEAMCKKSSPFAKLLFCLLNFIDYLKTPEGKDAWENREMNFERMFGDTICRVMANRSGYSYETLYNRNLRQSLLDSFAFLSFLFQKKIMPLHRNLCFLLMVVSCIEGRGVYHGRTANGLSMPHKCYRYMIEKLGGRIYRQEPVANLHRAEKELMATFE